MLNYISAVLAATVHDLQGVAYVMPACTAPEVIGGNAGVQHPLLSFRFRDELQAAGLWRGPGFTCLVREDVPTLEVATHELGHWLCDPPFAADADARFDAATEEIKTLATTRLWEAMPDHVPAPEVLPWLVGGNHDLQFLRAVAHVAWRVEAAGGYVCQLDLLPPHGYQLSPFSDYFRAFRDELSSRADEPIRSILSTCTTDAASKLWLSDVATFCERSI